MHHPDPDCCVPLWTEDLWGALSHVNPLFFFLLTQAGIEPRTFSVKGRRSTTQLSPHCIKIPLTYGQHLHRLRVGSLKIFRAGRLWGGFTLYTDALELPPKHEQAQLSSTQTARASACTVWALLRQAARAEQAQPSLLKTVRSDQSINRIPYLISQCHNKLTLNIYNIFAFYLTF